MRSNKTVPIVLAALGVLLLGAAAILEWWVVPRRAQLPADTNTVRGFSGTARVLLNPQAIAGGNLSAALLVDQPVTAQRTVKVLATDGDSAEVSDARILATSTGQPLASTDTTYAVNRKTLEGASDAPQSWDATTPDGLTVSWPIGAEKKDYPVWVNETQTSATATFSREEQKNGINTYVYDVNVPAAPIKDMQVLGTLPTSLPTPVLGGLAADLPLPPEVKAQLIQALPALGGQVPLSYTYESKSTVWVEPTTGIVVDTDRQETRKAGLGSPAIAAVPVYDVATKFTEQTVAAAVDEASDKKGSLDQFGTTWPLILTVAGVVALLAALLVLLMSRRRTPVTPAPREDGPGQT